MADVQCRHHRDAIEADHFSRIANAAHLRIEITRGRSEFVDFFLGARNLIFLLENFDADGRRLAVLGVLGEQEGRRGQLPEDFRLRACVCGTRPGRQTRGALCRRRRVELLSKAVRAWMGAGL